MFKIRRTKAEIEAGLSVADKKAGLTLDEFLQKKDTNILLGKKKVQQKDVKTTLRVRRTKEEIAAGITFEEKQRGITLGEYKFAKEKLDKEKAQGQVVVSEQTKDERHAALRKWLREPLKSTQKIVQDETKVVTPYTLDKTVKSEDDTVVTHYKSREVIVTKYKDVPVIREVRVLFGNDGTPKTVNEIIREELSHVKYEWKKIPMDKNFRSKDADDLGKEGWRFTHIFTPGYIKESWKNKPAEMWFSRPKLKEDGKSKRTGTVKKCASYSAKNAERSGPSS